MRYAHLATLCLAITLLVAPVAAHQAARSVAFTVFFEEQSAEITTRFVRNIDSAFQVDRFANSVWHEDGNGWVRVVAHVDFKELGPKSSILGLNRAKAVANELMLRGIDPRRIVTINQGAHHLPFPDASVEGNRFVEVTLCKGHPPACDRVYYY